MRKEDMMAGLIWKHILQVLGPEANWASSWAVVEGMDCLCYIFPRNGKVLWGLVSWWNDGVRVWGWVCPWQTKHAQSYHACPFLVVLCVVCVVLLHRLRRTGLAMRNGSLYKFRTPNTSELPSRPLSKQPLLQTNLHEFLCIDCSFSEAVFYSFSRNLVEAACQPVP